MRRLREYDCSAYAVRRGTGIVAVLEGGYDLDALASSARAHVETLASC